MQTRERLSISCGGISLLEVLVAIFVLSIGLLGVLAVIPFGALQISKAQHAEHAANMLANAAEEIVFRKMVNPTNWGIEDMDVGSGILLKKVTPPADPEEEPDPPYLALNCTKFIWYELGEMTDPPHHIFGVSTFMTEKKWDEVMCGQDDLVYTTYGDKRPDFAGQKDKIQSTKKYTWFFTFLPETATNPKDAVPLIEVKPYVAVDVLACYNRVPRDDTQVQPSDFAPSFGGGTFTFDAPGLAELLTQTKYVFVTWEKTPELEGAWCKIVFLDKSKPKIVVTGGLPDLTKDDYSNIQVYIPSGVLYHKRLTNVPMF